MAAAQTPGIASHARADVLATSGKNWKNQSRVKPHPLPMA